jgi:hypothetical protein
MYRLECYQINSPTVVGFVVVLNTRCQNVPRFAFHLMDSLSLQEVATMEVAMMKMINCYLS